MKTSAKRPAIQAIDPVELLRRCLREPSDADWLVFHQQFGGLLRRLLGGMVLRRIHHFDSDQLDDALQELYSRLLRYRGEFAGSSDRQLWGFLCRTAASVVVDTWRRCQRRTGMRERSCGLLRTDDSLIDVLWFTQQRPSSRTRDLPPSAPPSAFLSRSPEEILIEREDALRRFLKLPRCRRRRWWRRNLRYLV